MYVCMSMYTHILQTEMAKFGLTLPFKTSKIELSNFVLDVSKFSTGIFSANFNFARGKGTALLVLQLPVNAAGVLLCVFVKI